jgi:hypothetical protein
MNGPGTSQERANTGTRESKGTEDRGEPGRRQGEGRDELGNELKGEGRAGTIWTI